MYVGLCNLFNSMSIPERYVQKCSSDSPPSEPLVKSNDKIVGGECYDPWTYV